MSHACMWLIALVDSLKNVMVVAGIIKLTKPE